MEKWSHKSLEWIHKVREENYQKSRHLHPEEVIKQTFTATSELIQELNLKLLYPEDIFHTFKKPG